MSGRLDEIRARWAEVTPWPWSQDGNNAKKLRGVDGDTFAWVLPDGDTSGTWTEQNQRDMHALANAPADVAWLVKQVETLASPHSLFTVMAERDEAQARRDEARANLRAATAERDDALHELARERKRVETLTALLDAQVPGGFAALMDHVEAGLKAQGWVKGTEADKLIEGAVAVDVLRRVDTVLTAMAAMGVIAPDDPTQRDVRRFLEKVEVPRG